MACPACADSDKGVSFVIRETDWVYVVAQQRSTKVLLQILVFVALVASVVVLLIVPFKVFRMRGWITERAQLWFRTAWKRAEPSDEDIAVKIIMESQYVQFFHKVFPAALVFGFMHVAGDLLRVSAWDCLWRTPTDLWVAEQLVDGSLTCGTWMLAMSLVMVLLPNLVTKRSVYMLKMISVVLINMYVTCMPNLTQNRGVQASLFGYRTLMFTGCYDFSVVFWPNFLTAVYQAYLWTVHSGQELRLGVVVNELTLLGCLLLLTKITTFAVRGLTRAQLQVKNSSRFESAIESLLFGMCDAVVHLRDDFTVLRPSESLNAMLLKTSAFAIQEPSVQSFLDCFYVESEKAKFIEFVEARSRDLGTRSTLHVRLRDATGLPVSVQVFHSACQDILSQRFHIVGVQEVSEAENNTSSWSGTSLQTTGTPDSHSGLPKFKLPANTSASYCESVRQGTRTARQPDLPAHAAEGAAVIAQRTQNLGQQAEEQLQRGVSEGLSDELVSLASTERSLHVTSVRESLLAREETAVWVYGHLDGLPMVKCTTSFGAIVGNIPTLTRLLSLCAPGTQGSTERKCIQCVKDLCDDRVPKSFQMYLKPANMNEHVVEVTATSSINFDGNDVGLLDPPRREQDLPRPPNDDAICDDDMQRMPTLKLTFSGTKLRKVQRKGGRKRGASDGSPQQWRVREPDPGQQRHVCSACGTDVPEAQRQVHARLCRPVSDVAGAPAAAPSRRPIAL